MIFTIPTKIVGFHLFTWERKQKCMFWYKNMNSWRDMQSYEHK